MCRIFDNNRGLSLIELVVTMVILSILASMIVPSARMITTRNKEIELRRDLREMRNAIDEFKKNYDKAVNVDKTLPVVIGDSGYPKTLKALTEDFDFGGLTGKKKFLRRVPIDPMNPVKGDDDRWGMRSYVDEPDSTSWGREDVFDVYSLSEGIALDGTKYKDW